MAAVETTVLVVRRGLLDYDPGFTPCGGVSNFGESWRLNIF